MTKFYSKALSLLLALVLCFSVTLQAAPFVLTAEAKTITCPSCGGSGRGGVCPVCGGTRMQSSTTYQTNPITGFLEPSTIQLPCSACSGTGQGFCPRCNGAGVIDSSDSSSSSSSSSSTSSYTEDGLFRGGCVLEATQGVVPTEEAVNLFDGDKNTKFNIYGDWGYVIWKAPKMIKVTGYSLMTANDTATYKGRNPKMWSLWGCNSEEPFGSDNWVELDFVEKDTKLKAKNFKTYDFELPKKAKAYRYYMFIIKKNKGDDCTQLAELKLIGKTYTSKATALSSVKKKSKTSFKAKWKKQSKAKGYQLQYSTSSKFKKAKKITVKSVKTTSKTVKGLKKGKKYYVRVRTYKVVNGCKVYSKWSKKKAVKL